MENYILEDLRTIKIYDAETNGNDITGKVWAYRESNGIISVLRNNDFSDDKITIGIKAPGHGVVKQKVDNKSSGLVDFISDTLCNNCIDQWPLVVVDKIADNGTAINKTYTFNKADGFLEIDGKQPRLAVTCSICEIS